MTTKRRARTIGTGCVWPSGVEVRYGISAPTRWRWEKLGMLPARDVFVAGKAVGWRPETLDAADRGASNKTRTKSHFSYTDADIKAELKVMRAQFSARSLDPKSQTDREQLLAECIADLRLRLSVLEGRFAAKEK